MSKKSFNNRYSIEYIHPGSLNDTPPTKKKRYILLLFLLLFFSSITVLLWKQGFLDQFILENFSDENSSLTSTSVSTFPDNIKLDSKTIENTTTPISKIIVASNTKIELEKGQVEIKPLTNDKRLLESKLNTLSKQLPEKLSIERKINTELSEKSNNNQQISNKLSQLYEEAILEVSASDEKFIQILKDDKNRTIAGKASSPSSQSSTNKDIANIAIAQDIGSNKDIKNTVELSTSSQTGLIISAINNTNNNLNKPSITENTTNAILKSLKLQKQINKLVDPKNIPDTAFTKALKTEASIRKNAMRSIIVKKGESLWSIAKRAYGKGYKYPKIMEANPELKKGKIVLLHIGQVLRVPR